MDLDQLTIGEAKELATMFANQVPSNSVATGSGLIGKYAIVRSNNEGINAGVISEMDETGIIIKEARRIWYHRPADKKLAWYEGVALSGLDDSSKVSAEVEVKAIIEDYSVTLCTITAEYSIRAHKSHEQS